MIKTYSPKQVLIALGSHAVTGYAEDTFITIEKNGDGISKKVGCDGEVVRSLDPDQSYNVKLTLLQTSPTNAWLQGMYDRDIATGGDGMFPILAKDIRGGLVFNAESAWVAKPPSRDFGKESGNREWDIQTGEGTLNGEQM